MSSILSGNQQNPFAKKDASSVVPKFNPFTKKPSDPQKRSHSSTDSHEEAVPGMDLAVLLVFKFLSQVITSSIFLCAAPPKKTKVTKEPKEPKQRKAKSDKEKEKENDAEAGKPVGQDPEAVVAEAVQPQPLKKAQPTLAAFSFTKKKDSVPEPAAPTPVDTSSMDSTE